MLNLYVKAIVFILVRKNKCVYFSKIFFSVRSTGQTLVLLYMVRDQSVLMVFQLLVKYRQ